MQFRSTRVVGWFAIDFISVLTILVDLIPLAIDTGPAPADGQCESLESGGSVVQKLKLLRLLRVLRLIKLARLARASRLIQRWVGTPRSHPV